MLDYKPIINEITYNGYTLGVLRLDLIHPEISGNKWFKLKYNLQQATLENKNTIITFGGAFSNHIAATAFACKLAGLKSIGIIRGEATSAINTTLSQAKEWGMELHFKSREDYSKKNNTNFLNELQKTYPSGYIVPEGGDNALGKKGCEEILNSETETYSSIFCAVGTGTTFNGISKSVIASQKLFGINVLKYDAVSTHLNSSIVNEYHFGGYAKHTPELLEFKLWFEKEYQIPLDYVYTAKLFYAVFDMIKNNKIGADEKILIVHSGGLQGNSGYEKRYNLNPTRQVNDIQG